MKRLLFISLAVLLLAACGRRGSGQAASTSAPKRFPEAVVPSMMTEPAQAVEYKLTHFWDAFFKDAYSPCQDCILGVAKSEVETELATFIEIMNMVPKERAQAAMSKLFSQVEQKQRADSSSHAYVLMNELVVRYLYDPNSPYRDEDLYLPYVKGLAASDLTSADARPGYAYEAQMCSLNPYGSVAADFSFTTAQGRRQRLHDLRADYVVMFFSNPGCHSCKEIVDAFTSFPLLDEMVADGRAVVLNIYIDSELDKWREYLPNYPSSWICAYDHAGIIREDAIYNVRAIPSLYLLDSQKRVLMKDVPTEKLLDYLANIQ